MAPPSKRRKTDSKQPEEITFDLSARQDYLTGFHKRKVARAEHAREAAAKKEREEKVLERRQMREQRKEDLSKHVQEFNKVLRNQNPDLSSEESEAGDDDASATFEGFAEAEEKDGEAVDGQEDEYVDEDKYTTVTVEAMGESSEDDDQDESKDAAAKKAEPERADLAAGKTKKRPWTKEKPAGEKKKPKQKKRQFRYESKTERKETRNKQKAKNAKAAKARRER